MSSPLKKDSIKFEPSISGGGASNKLGLPKVVHAKKYGKTLMLLNKITAKVVIEPEIVTAAEEDASKVADQEVISNN